MLVSVVNTQLVELDLIRFAPLLDNFTSYPALLLVFLTHGSYPFPL
jgi:hypothetical protein